MRPHATSPYPCVTIRFASQVNQGVVDKCNKIPFGSYILITKSSERCAPKHKYADGRSASGTGKWPISIYNLCDGTTSSGGGGGSSSSGGGVNGGLIFFILLLVFCGAAGGAYYYGAKNPDSKVGKMIPPKYKWDVVGPKAKVASSALQAKIKGTKRVLPAPATV